MTIKLKLSAAALGFLASLGLVFIEQGPQEKPQGPVGYENTPLIPGQRWRVHDKHRPVPPVVEPGAGFAPPSDATVLFDGSSLDAWSTPRGGPAKWKLVDGAMEVNGTGTIQTKESFGDCQLHLEWRAPTPAKGKSQGRGNSGVFFMTRYEVQILDSFRNRSYADGQASALYGQWPPMVNACRAPGEWQRYDLIFEAPRFDQSNKELLRPARVTAFHNGVLTHHARTLLGPTRHLLAPAYVPHEAQGPLRLQDHGNPVRFRNIWIRRLSL